MRSPSEDEAAEADELVYVDFEIGAALRDEWQKLHKVGTTGAFPENTNLATIITSYRTFLQQHFKEGLYKDVVMTRKRVDELNGNIKRAIDEMQAAIEVEGNEEYFNIEGGSRRRRQRIPLYRRIFSMSTREFRRLF